MRIEEENANILNEFEDRERRRPNLIVSSNPEKQEGSVEDRQVWDAIRIRSLLQDLGGFNDDNFDEHSSCRQNKFKGASVIENRLL